MKQKIFGKAMFLSMALWLLEAVGATAQGIVVNKADGTKVYYKAEEVTSVSLYGYGEEPEPGQGLVKTFTAAGVSFAMITVEGGVFQMGHKTRGDDERPVHQVKLSTYMIGQTEVTQELWEAVMGSNPSSRKGIKLPVEHISWDDCQTFITKLNQLTGLQFRLPTEAEWEFAARGGTKSKGYFYSGSNDYEEVAWCNENSNNKTHEVATMAPNELGIFDMSGNVLEWCQDWYSNSYYSESPFNNPTGPTSGYYRVCRSGNYEVLPGECRVDCRYKFAPSLKYDIHGFRLALQ